MSAHILPEMEPASRKRKQGRDDNARDMDYTPSTRAAQRARWLAELSDALEAAERLSVDLLFCGVDRMEMNSLALRLRCLRAQIDMMRLCRNDDWPEEAPLWSNLAS
jgi:aryl carrier-like protein